MLRATFFVLLQMQKNMARTYRIARAVILRIYLMTIFVNESLIHTMYSPGSNEME